MDHDHLQKPFINVNRTTYFSLIFQSYNDFYKFLLLGDTNKKKNTFENSMTYILTLAYTIL